MVEPIKKPGSYEIEREGLEINMLINCLGCPYYPSIEENAICMEETINKLIEAGPVTTIIFKAQRNYIYPYQQTLYLNEIAKAFVHLVKEKEVLNMKRLEMEESTRKYIAQWYADIKKIMTLMKSDPIGAYVIALRLSREQKAELKVAKEELKQGVRNYLAILEEIELALEVTQLIRLAEPFLAGHEVGDRELYRKFFEPLIKPNFMYTRLMSEPPARAEEIASYLVGESTVVIYELQGKVRPLYHIIPPEFQLDEHEYSLLDDAREVMVKFKPRREEFVNPERMREVFFNIAKDLIEELSKEKKYKVSYKKIEKLANILVRLTVGFGLIEVLLSDEQIEDVFVNSPVGSTPVIVKHSEYGECETNIFPNIKEADAWASRFRMLSGRALDEANPVLDTELETSVFRARVAITQEPLTPTGLNLTFRRHRVRPWTLPLFLKYKFLTPIAAGVLWFLIDGSKSMLVAGTRGSGKTSLLGSLLVEIMRKYRIISIEDTLEIPINYLRKIDYNVLSMKVRSAIVGSKSELSAADGIRTALRLGDSCLIMGEVRSQEALSLYEAMRIGATANVVAGTIHADSPYGLFDRVVNDLGVPRTSFKATDVIIIANKLRDPSGIHEFRRLTDVTEVRKDWEEDPVREHAFVKLLNYDPKKDILEPTRDLIEGESEVIKSIAGRVKAWSGNWDLVWDNIQLRAKLKDMIRNYSEKSSTPEIMEADFVVQANDQYHKIFEELTRETGYPESKDVIYNFENWLKLKIKEMTK